MKLSAPKNNEQWISREIARLKTVEKTYRSRISALEAALEALKSPAPEQKATVKEEGTKTKDKE